ncbi:site-specific tyrosine recombinase/integron integrase [Picrophilus oshimae]|uniref:Tyrosine recombinase XerA n=1 Tax=Picrophilus torridus (strain ATCC 700027 / DSM 9790 / JCM 10055 / NBRC 100828 / KAW 2/3) TaxID=1122961 RepID=A0A8G2FVI3_PICTO|nr:site-specific tyrosine recombinase/integron integrase [Picrophilus oshimae]SMD30256.1 integrase/recombinase XerD [Picrophilus oshimae DSM 9789]
MDYIKNFENYMIGERKSLNTIKEYKSLVRDFINYINKKPEDINDFDIEDYKRHLAVDKRYSKSSQYLSMKAIKLFLQSRDIKIPRTLNAPRRNKKIPVYLNTNEAKNLIKASSNNRKHLAIVSLLLYSGIRVSELCNLKIEDIDLNENIIYVRSGKGGKDRIAIIPDECSEILRSYYNDRLKYPGDTFFISNKKSRYDTSTIERLIKKLAVKAGIEKHVTPHVLRHTFATSVLRNGGDIRFIQQILGHASVATTQIYTHIDDGTLKDMYKKHRPDY